MKSLRRYLIRMIIFLMAVAAVVVLLFPALERIFLHNAPLNGMILGAAFIGVIYIFRQVLQLQPELAWIEDYKKNRQGTPRPAPRLLGPMVTMLGDRRDRAPSLSTISMRTLLDGISARLEESRDISHYLIGLMIFLGLLGTFWGLLETVNSVGGVISGLEIGSRDATAIFNGLKTGLERPLSGMGTSFSSSLFGLASSLVLGFLDLQAGQAQNLFYQELEEWLSGLTRLTGGSPVAEGDTSVPAYIEALLEKTADSLDKLQRAITTTEEGRAGANTQQLTLNERLTTLSDLMRAEQVTVSKLVEGQIDIRPILMRLAEGGDRLSGLTDLLRNEQTLLGKLVEGQMRLAEGGDRLGGLTDALRNEHTLLGKLVEGQMEMRPVLQRLAETSERLSGLTELMRTEQTLLGRLVEGQREVSPVLARLAEATDHGGVDEATRAHIRNLDVYMARLVEEMSLGRQRTVDELRAEIRLLARTIANLAEEAGT